MSPPAKSTEKPRYDLDWGDQTPIEPDPVTLIDRAKSVALWGICGSFLAGGMTAATAARQVWSTDECEWIDRAYIKRQLVLTGSKWKAVVHPGVKDEQQYMFIQNHVNHLDYASMYNATKHFKQGVELKDHFKYPLYGPFMESRGTIPVVRGSAEGLKQLIKGIRAEVERGHSILAFPEGTRTSTGRVAPFKPGLFRIASQIGLPIVPVAVTGMYEVMRKDSLMIRPGYEVTVFYDEPVPTVGLKESDMPALMQHVHTTIRTRVDDYWRSRGKL